MSAVGYNEAQCGVSVGRQALSRPSGIEELAPLVACQAEVQVFHAAKASHSQPEAPGQTRRGASIDQEPGAVLERCGHEVVCLVAFCELPHLDLADLASATASMDVVGDDIGGGGVRIEPRAGGRVGFELEHPTFDQRRPAA